MSIEFSKVIEISCDNCNRKKTYWYEVSTSVKIITASVRHIEGWMIGRKKCLCPRCKKEAKMRILRAFSVVDSFNPEEEEGSE